jgi:hypothetical protein
MAISKKLAQDLPSNQLWHAGWLTGPCQCRSRPLAVAEGQHLQGPVSQPQSAIEVGGWTADLRARFDFVPETSPFSRGFAPPPTMIAEKASDMIVRQRGVP